jgi:hydroxyacylglutathione hydrolase
LIDKQGLTDARSGFEARRDVQLRLAGRLGRGSLLELDEALISMHGTPKRLALRDFSVWPSGPSFGSPAENEAYKKGVDQQRAEMWDHDKQ